MIKHKNGKYHLITTIRKQGTYSVSGTTIKACFDKLIDWILSDIYNTINNQRMAQ